MNRFDLDRISQATNSFEPFETISFLIEIEDESNIKEIAQKIEPSVKSFVENI